MLFNKKAKDPVCGMEIKVEDSTLRSAYGGTEYNFCSNNCLEKFEKEPQLYVAEPSDCCGKGGQSNHCQHKEHGHEHHGHEHHCNHQN